MYVIFSLLKWVVLIYLVKTGRISESTLIKFKKFSLAVISMVVLHASMIVHVVDSVDFIGGEMTDGYIQRRII
ncbi:hypothetical protein L4D77_25450 [Photobacterium frigidiphilum]|uniref:hypothetical protein n=1 Tax=Photobacterium frigidiphilum TaxID=264736 RepID=UPI003D0C260D